MLSRFYRIFFIIVLLSVSGCGYHVAGKGNLQKGINILYIPLFGNATNKPDIEAVITSAFVDEFIAAVEVNEDSDTVMVGTIRSYVLTPVSYTKSDVNQEYRLAVTLSLRIERDGVIIWEDMSFNDYEDFTVNIADVSATKDAEAAAFEKLSKDAARLVKERLIEDF